MSLIEINVGQRVRSIKLSEEREFGLLCPVCESHNLRVYETRSFGGELRRKRECLTCLSRFRTVETIIKVIRDTRRR